MYLPDINVWLGLAFLTHQHHAKAKAWYVGLAPSATFRFCRVTQQGFLRLSTNPKSTPHQPQTMSEAWVVYDNFFTSSSIGFANEPAGIDSQWRQLTQRNTYSHKVWNDAYLAAFAICAGLELVTLDQGFRQFPGLKLTLLT